MAEEYNPNECFTEHSVGDAFMETGDLKSCYPFHNDTDSKISDLKCSLEGWRELLLQLNSILHWEKQWHPFSIMGVITAVFMTLWVMELSILTTLATLCLTMTVCEFLVPQISASFLKQEPWSEKHEEQYDRICRNIIITKEKMFITCRSFSLLRTTRPKIYYAIVITTLVFLAWIGNSVDNLLLLYLSVSFVFLLPGLEERGYLQKYGSLLTDKIADLATSAKIDTKNADKTK